ncbi:unnamed protein product [Clonostachys rosea]|uniref:Uncharacterized protein n=1 Tax=Bionectria ochroleuca TaxID=29856 RepID=A0ABY6TMJ0_BIOOC|nr:unnamed protein product [Clonostachys rosea]
MVRMQESESIWNADKIYRDFDGDTALHHESEGEYRYIQTAPVVILRRLGAGTQVKIAKDYVCF